MKEPLSTICVDIKLEGDSLLRAISFWLTNTNEQHQTLRVFNDLMIQLVSGLHHDPRFYALYVKDMPSYEPFKDLLAYSLDTQNLTSVCREVGMSIFFKINRILGDKFPYLEILPKHITTNSLFLDLYQVNK